MICGAVSAPPERKLRNAWQGALAGGGDPASSPLYVFGPFLSLIVAAGVAQVTFGPSIWLAVVTIVVVALLYRLVMRWVVDGSGGTGLSEEELGPWAAKASAAITFIEYTLTFLVSIAALVTFIADRVGLNGVVLGLSGRTFLTLVIAVVCGALVNRGPRVVSYVFGPATAAVLALLWIMMFATVAKRGLQLAPFDLAAFRGRYLGFTLGGFVRVLALMTGIEVFANLVAAYAGPPEVRSRRAFSSLTIIMGSTALTMLIVGPAIFALSDPARVDVSVFTQAMDALLPRPLALAGTAISVAVLLSAAAASALGIQNLFLGLSVRHYAPAPLARLNKVGVASRPVWTEVAVACGCFVVLGSDEATYLAMYAAGVFVLLSMTAWSAVLRIVRRRRLGIGAGLGTLMAVVGAAVFTTTATVIVFVERFSEGVWIYALLVPALAAGFGFVRRQRGDPGPSADRTGRLLARWNGGDLFPLAFDALPPAHEVQSIVEQIRQARHGSEATSDASTSAMPVRIATTTLHWVKAGATEPGPWKVIVPLDGSAHAESALAYAAAIGREEPIELLLVHVHSVGDIAHANDYLEVVSVAMREHCASVAVQVLGGEPGPAIVAHAVEQAVTMVVMATHGRTGVRRAVAGSVALDVMAAGTCSVLMVTAP